MIRFNPVRSYSGFALLLATGLLAACGGTSEGLAPGPNPRTTPLSAPVSDTPVKIGAPYTIGGVTYTPEDVADYDAVGYASWYGGDHDGGTTANGEILRATAVSAAHRTLPLPSYVEVTALDTGRTIVVRINDRGPYSGNRIIDLSAGAAEQLGIAGSGSAAVRVRRVNPSDPDKAMLRSGGRAPERIATPEDLLVVLRKQLSPAAAPTPVPPVTTAKSRPSPPAKPAATPKPVPPKPPIVEKSGRYIVQVATFSSQERADVAAKKLGAMISPSGALFRVRLGPFASEAAARAAVNMAAAKGYPGGRIMANDSP